MSITNKQFWKQLNHIVSVIPRQYMDALLTLHDKLEDKNVKWIINGDLGERLRVVQVEPESIEIITSKNDVSKIFDALKAFDPQPLSLQSQQLPRNALFEGKEYPIYTRSFGFNFILKSIPVKVQGDLQFKVGDWEWGDVYDFTPEYVYIVGKKVAVTPLSVKIELYKSLGWIDRLQKIQEVTRKPRSLKR
jgi:hypothetical protein